MADYIFTRTLSDNRYTIENISRIDGEDSPIHVCKEIETVLPGKFFKMICHGNECKFIFTEDLTPEEQITLENALNAHINNT